MEKGTTTAQGSAASAQRIPLMKKLDDALVSFGEGHAKVMLGLRIAFQVISAAIVVFFGMSLFTLAGIAGFSAFIDTAFAGLTLQTTNPAFFNGTVASLVLLLVAYGALTLLMVSPARLLGDAAALYCLFFSLTVPLYQFSQLVAPVAVVYAIWVVHRVVLGTIVFRYRKLTAVR